MRLRIASSCSRRRPIRYGRGPVDFFSPAMCTQSIDEPGAGVYASILLHTVVQTKVRCQRSGVGLQPHAANEVCTMAGTTRIWFLRWFTTQVVNPVARLSVGRLPGV